MRYIIQLLKLQVHLAKCIALTFADAKVMGLLVVNAIVAGTSAVVYSALEGWSLLDATYFAVVTAATIGYGDFAPVTALGRAFTIFYVVIEVGLFVLLATAVSTTFYRTSVEHSEK